MTQVPTNMFAAPQVNTFDPLTPGAREAVAGIREGSQRDADRQLQGSIAAADLQIKQEALDRKTQYDSLMLDLEKTRTKVEQQIAKDELAQLKDFQTKSLELKEQENKDRAALKEKELDILGGNAEADRQYREEQSQFNRLNQKMAVIDQKMTRLDERQAKAVEQGQDELQLALAAEKKQYQKELSDLTSRAQIVKTAIEKGPVDAAAAVSIGRTEIKKLSEAEQKRMEERAKVVDDVLLNIQTKKDKVSRENIVGALQSVDRRAFAWLSETLFGEKIPEDITEGMTAGTAAPIGRGMFPGGRDAFRLGVFSELEQEAYAPLVITANAIGGLAEKGLIDEGMKDDISQYAALTMKEAWGMVSGNPLDETEAENIREQKALLEESLYKTSGGRRAVADLGAVLSDLASGMGDDTEGKQLLGSMFSRMGSSMTEDIVPYGELLDSMENHYNIAVDVLASSGMYDDEQWDEDYGKMVKKFEDNLGYVPQPIKDLDADFKAARDKFYGKRDELGTIEGEIRETEGDLKIFELTEAERTIEVRNRIRKQFDSERETLNRMYERLGMEVFEADDEEGEE